MADYTREELEQMLGEKILQEEAQLNAELTSSAEYLFDQDMGATIKSNDYEMVVHKTNDAFAMPIIRVHKSKTQGKQFIETPHYWQETKNGEIVSLARTNITCTSSSYGTSYTVPPLSVLGTREKDLTIYKG
jgi:hypothetical protein